ncbi:carbohydrate kinase family protein [Neisseriaceae bacterium B1]
MKVTSFGEVLWDTFPDGKKVLGGAPLNVVVRLSQLGFDAKMISRRGDDEDGQKLVRQIAAKNVATDLIQVDKQHATSQVKIELDERGCATYEIVYPCAWDKIAAEEAAMKSVAQSDAFVYGSLCIRDEVSRQALQQLVQAAQYRVFDVNLRKPFYEPDVLLAMMKQADVVKLNDDELYELAPLYGSSYHSLAQHARFLAQLTNTHHLCVTLGSRGAIYLRDGQIYSNQGYRVEVADTVGAGDNFLAGFVYKLMQGAEPDEILTFACALGALAAAQHGATPDISEQQILAFMDPVAH